MKTFYSTTLRGLYIACMFLFAATAASAQTDNWTDTGNYADSWQGTGTQTSPYKISTAAELAKLSYETNFGTQSDYSGSYFVLTADIDLSGHYWRSIKNLDGNLDGGGHLIKNMIFDSQNLPSYLTLIGTLKANGVIRNLHVGSELSIEVYGDNSVPLTWPIGSIVVINSGIISNCVNTGNITVSQSDYKSANVAIGGIAATNNNTIKDCYTTGNIKASGPFSCVAGGISGLLSSPGTITSNCFSTGTINTAKVTGRLNSSGGVLGFALANGSITNSYFLQEDPINTGLKGVGGIYSGVTITDDTHPKTPAELKAAAFVNTLNGSQSPAPWQSDLSPNINSGYPILKWQNPSITALPQTTVNTIKFYPNPARNYIELQGTTTILPVKIFDMTGRMMINTQVKPGEKLNIAPLAKGWYTINIDGQNLKMLKDEC